MEPIRTRSANAGSVLERVAAPSFSPRASSLRVDLSAKPEIGHKEVLACVLIFYGSAPDIPRIHDISMLLDGLPRHGHQLCQGTRRVNILRVAILVKKPFSYSIP
jgi:hypothetical protein